MNFFGLEKRYLGLSCRHVRQSEHCVGPGAFRSSCARQVRRWPNTHGPRVNGEATPMVAHELTGGRCCIHALADWQGRDMAERRGIGSEKIRLVCESRCAAEILSGPATIIRNLSNI
jgi:hypothetical protein